MSPTDIIKSYYNFFNDKNFDAMAELTTEDVVHGINEGIIESGRMSFRKFLDLMDSYYDETVVDLQVFTGQNPSRMAAEFSIHGTYKSTCAGLPAATGQKYDIPVGAFFELKDGKISRITNYYNMQDWIRQVSK